MSDATLAGRRSLQLVRILQQQLDGQRPLRLIGLDVGMRRIGLSWTGNELNLASSLGFVTYPRSADVRSRHWVSGCKINILEHAGVYSSISKICQTRHPDVLIVGYPYERDGSEGPSCRAVRQFIAGLMSWHPGQWQRPATVFWDEQFTSTTAYSNRVLLRKAIRNGDPRLDADAAALILQSFLDALNSAPGLDADYNDFDGQPSFSEHLEEKSLRLMRFQQRQRGKRTR